MGFGVWGLGFGVWGLGFRAWTLNPKDGVQAMAGAELEKEGVGRDLILGALRISIGFCSFQLAFCFDFFVGGGGEGVLWQKL